MMGRKVRRNLPLVASGQMDYDKEDFDKRDRIAKLKSKEREDSRRGARKCQVGPGDTVIVERNNRGKGDTRFHTKRYTVMEQHNGNLVLIDDEGQLLKRHVSQTRKVYEWRKEDEDVSKTKTTEIDVRADLRPVRERRAPGYLENYVRCVDID